MYFYMNKQLELLKKMNILITNNAMSVENDRKVHLKRGNYHSVYNSIENGEFTVIMVLILVCFAHNVAKTNSMNVFNNFSTILATHDVKRI